MMSREAASICALCLLWYIVSSSNNVIGKMLLNEFPYPMTVTMVQLTSISVYSGPFFNLWNVRKFVDIPWPYYMQYIVPLALGKFLASVSSHISIWKVPVSYAHTGKSHSHTHIHTQSRTIKNLTSVGTILKISHFVQSKPQCRCSPSSCRV